MTMPVYKKFLIAIIILLFTYILYRLYRKRLLLLKEQNKEGYLNGKTPEQELNNIKNTDINMSVRSINSAYTQYPLSQYMIKGSYNSAITKNYVSLDMLQYVLSRGCRFIDFEVFYLDGKPMVSYSNDPNFAVLETNNRLLLDNVLASAVANAFNSPSPNKDDPLFIQLRIKSNDTIIYNEVAKSINNTLITRLYKDKITKTTKLSDIMGKVVLVMDRTINYKYKDFTKCPDPNDKTCYDLTNFINIESGSDFMRTSDYTTITNKSLNPPTINNNNVTTDLQYIQIVTPDVTSSSVSNPDSMNLIKNYGCQVILYSFYNKDEALTAYEELFNNNLYAIVPMATTLIYLHNDPRGVINSVENTYNSILGIKLNNGNNGGLSTSLNENTSAIIIGSVLGGVVMLLIIGGIAASKSKKPV